MWCGCVIREHNSVTTIALVNCAVSIIKSCDIHH